eukprot:763105-Hanusia_phi.AAC.3
MASSLAPSPSSSLSLSSPPPPSFFSLISIFPCTVPLPSGPSISFLYVCLSISLLRLAFPTHLPAQPSLAPHVLAQTKFVAMPAKAGTGLQCSLNIARMCQAIGIKDIKVGSRSDTRWGARGGCESWKICGEQIKAEQSTAEGQEREQERGGGPPPVAAVKLHGSTNAHNVTNGFWKALKQVMTPEKYSKSGREMRGEERRGEG